jgi:hypothetical protein
VTIKTETASNNAREWTSGDRVEHAHRLRSYGAGVITEILPASLAKVRFEGESAARLIWVDDLTLIEPAAPRVIWSARGGA